MAEEVKHYGMFEPSKKMHADLSILKYSESEVEKYDATKRMAGEFLRNLGKVAALQGHIVGTRCGSGQRGYFVHANAHLLPDNYLLHKATTKMLILAYPGQEQAHQMFVPLATIDVATQDEVFYTQQQALLKDLSQGLDGLIQ